LKKTTFTAKTPDGNLFAVRFFNSHTNIQTSYENNRPQITIELVLEGDLIATQSKVPIDKLTRFKELEEEAQKNVEQKIKGTITHVQEEYGVDIFGFGETMYRQHYQQFKSIKDYWDEEFKKAEINVNAKVLLRRDGIRTRSFLEEME
jgi:spore germination protein KC